MTTETGGPAFPVQGFEYLNDADPAGPERIVHTPYPGMTLRDYFAAKAMQAMVNSGTYETGGWDQRDIAIQSYQMADAMIEARTK